MGCKRAKNKKDKEQIKNISKSDEFQLSLLNLQVKIILIYMISNIFLFGGTLQSINISCNKKASDSNPNILLIEGQYLALIASILISYVYFTSYNDFVPSVTMGIKIGKTQNLRGGYNMRIWRPGIWNLNPYFDDRNPMFISQGNSNLESEKSHSFNLSYSMFSMKFNVNISLRHSFGNNGIERVSRLIGKGGEEFPGGHHAPEGALYSTYENIGKNRNTGLSLYGNWNASPNTRIYLNGDGSYVDIKSPAQGLHNYGWNASLYGGIQHTFPLKIRASLNAGGSTPYISLQGKGSGYYYYSLGVNRSFIKDRFTVSAYVSNIFEKYRSYNNTTMGENFLSKSSSRYQSRSFGISLSYRIGELKASVKKAARSINNDDVKGGGGQGGQGGGAN